MEIPLARYKKTNLASALFRLGQRLPAWLGIPGSIALFAGLRYFGGADLPQMPAAHGMDDLLSSLAEYVPRVMAHLAQYILPPLLLLGGLARVVKVGFGRWKYSRIAAGSDIGSGIRALSWKQFEHFTAEAFRKKGFNVSLTADGADGGIDLVLRKDGELYLVQCKQWKSLKVGVQVVRELYGVMAAQGAAGGFVVCSGQYTPEAKKFAKGTSIELIDGETLESWLSAHKKGVVSTALPIEEQFVRNAPPAIAEESDGKHCAACGKPMVLRIPKAKAGGMPGKPFLGCSGFPACRKTQQV